MTLSLDTHRMIKRLTQAGFTEPQAETFVDVVREAHDFDVASLATKADLSAGLAELRADTAGLGKDLRAEIAAQGAELRAEIAAQGAELRAEIAAQGAGLRAEMVRLEASVANGKAELLKWMIGLILVQGGVVVGLIRLLPMH